MQIIREKEKLYIIAKDELEAKTTELLINPLLQQISSVKEKSFENNNDWEKFKELTKDFKKVPQSEIDNLAEEVDELMWQDYKKRHAV